MNEIYWITRFDAISNISGIGLALATCAFVAGIIGWICLKSEIAEYQHKEYRESELKEDECKLKIYMKLLKFGSIIGIICLMPLIFLPTTKEAFMIYGLGGTIDYVKSSDKAKELPDKVVDALTRYVDTIAKEEQEQE